MMRIFTLVLTVLALAVSAMCQDGLLVWGFECRENKCVKVPLNDENNAQGQTVCRMLCGEEIGTLWPKPSGTVKKGSTVIQVNRHKIKIITPSNLTNKRLWRDVKTRFYIQVMNKIPERSSRRNIGQAVIVNISVEEAPMNSDELPKLTYDTDESYSLRISEKDEQVLVEISGKTFFGARHGLETLSQVIVYDEIGDSIKIIADTEINDAPTYKHRGIILDTARNYFSVKSIKRTINGMAMTKLNVFHWHITDSSSFPLVVPSRPDLHNLGAYSAHKIYTRADIVDVVEYARTRGVRVIPEFENPAHVGEGWQNTKVVTCFNAQPWSDFCYQAPCGQFDPTIDELYDILEDIYREIFEAFNPDVFHMGLDSVSYACWNASEPIRNWILAKGWSLKEDGFIRLWAYFYKKALATLEKVALGKNVSVIIHGSPIVDEPYIDEFLDKSRDIIQFFSNKPGSRTDLAKSRGVRIIASTLDQFIDGNNANHKGKWDEIGGWQLLYESRPEKVIGGPSNLLLGSEAGVYTEQIDEFSLDSFVWPKVSALGERLWSNPDHGWQKANSRFSMHRTHLTENGLGAAAIQPEWCFLNNDECPEYAYD